ncbi:hypothetical protein [Nocardia xishanensis]
MTGEVDPRECFASEMDAALGRYDEYIDIRDPDVFSTWQATPGLRCLVCRHPVTVYRSSAKNPFVRHGKGNAATGDAREKKTARETFLHYRLKHWVAAELKSHGSPDARVEAHLDTRTPDVFGHIKGRGYAVEVQWSALSRTVAEARTRDLLAGGAHEVLWLTRTCTWAEQLPVLGIRSFDPDDDDYWAHTGFLTHRPQLGLRVAHVSVRAAVRDWVNGELAWAYQDHKKAAWATVTDWKQHTKDQADEIAAKKRQLADALRERDRLKQVLDTARTSLASNAETIKNQATTIDRSLDQQQALEDQITRLNTELHQVQQGRDDERRLRIAAESRVPELTEQIRHHQAALQVRHAAIVVLAIIAVVLGVALLLLA